jgi:hypothetical protein
MLHAAQDAELVRDLGALGQELTEANAFDVGLDGLRERAGVVRAGLGFGVEGVRMGRPAPHPDLDHGACLLGPLALGPVRRLLRDGPQRVTRRERGRAQCASA